jgi:hypothetical protein
MSKIILLVLLLVLGSILFRQYVEVVQMEMGASNPFASLVPDGLDGLMSATDPMPPEGVMAHSSVGQVVVEWAAMPRERYTLYLASAPKVGKKNYATLPDGMKKDGVTSPFAVPGPKTGQPLFFVLTEANSAGESGESVEVSAAPSLPAIALSAGSSHTCAVLVGGTVQCWGAFHQLGNSVVDRIEMCRMEEGYLPCSTLPVPVANVAMATALSTGRDTCVLESGGTIQCWGGEAVLKSRLLPCGMGMQSEGAGECLRAKGSSRSGREGPAASPLPSTVSGIGSAVSISGRGDETCAVLASGSIECWKGPDRNRSTVWGVSTAKSVAVGGAHACAVLSGGGVRCWGQNDSGQLGNNILPDSAVRVAVPGISNAVAVVSGYLHSCALLATGGVRCWGGNAYGQLGAGQLPHKTCRPAGCDKTPRAVAGITTATAISSGSYHTCVILVSGSVRCWGLDSGGKLGGVAWGYLTTPMTVPGITTAISVSAGSSHTCILLVGGQVRCWGSNDSGQIGKGMEIQIRRTRP